MRVVLDENNSLTEKAGAVFDEQRIYRFRLWREWAKGPRMLFCMLNPSTADAFVLDPTVRRCVSFAKREGCGSVEVVNVFALRSTDPKALKTHPDPVGSINDAMILAAAVGADKAVAAWGAHAAFMNRGLQVKALFDRHDIPLHYLALTKAGHPGHPLYIPGDAPLVRWSTP